MDANGAIQGLITIKDIEKSENFPNATKDQLGRLRVGGAVGVGADRADRVAALVAAGVDIIALDTAHGHAQEAIARVSLNADVTQCMDGVTVSCIPQHADLVDCYLGLHSNP